MNIISVIIRRHAWLLPFLVLGSAFTCALPVAMAYQPRDVAIILVFLYIGYLAIISIPVVLIVLSMWLKGEL